MRYAIGRAPSAEQAAANLEAAERFAHGRTIAEIAHDLWVTERSVRRWHRPGGAERSDRRVWCCGAADPAAVPAGTGIERTYWRMGSLGSALDTVQIRRSIGKLSTSGTPSKRSGN
jgi:predicted transcriptional regulator